MARLSFQFQTIHHARNNYTIQKVPAALHEKWQELFRKSNNTRIKSSAEVPIVEDHYIVIKHSAINNGRYTVVIYLNFIDYFKN